MFIDKIIKLKVTVKSIYIYRYLYGINFTVKNVYVLN